MKPLIVQFFVPAKEYTDPTYNQIGVNEELYKYSVKSIKKYAETYGIDYKMISKAKINHVHPTFERFDLFFNNDTISKFKKFTDEYQTIFADNSVGSITVMEIAA